MSTDAEILDRFQEPPFLDQLRGKDAVALVGGRGTGKTMAFRFLAHSAQRLAFAKQHELNDWSAADARRFAQTVGAIRVYMRLGSPGLHFMSRKLDEDIQTALFAHFFNLTVIQLVVQAVEAWLRDAGRLPQARVRRCVEEVLDAIHRDGASRGDVTDFAGLRRHALSLARKVADYGSTAILNPRPYDGPVSQIGEPIVVLSENLDVLIPAIAPVRIDLLLDEYENVDVIQQQVLNTLVKQAGPRLVPKLAMRLYGWKSTRTLNAGEQLQPDNDYLEIRLDEELFSQTPARSRYVRLLADIANKRLASAPGFRERPRASIEYYLPDLSVEDEAAAALGMSEHPLRSELESVIREVAGDDWPSAASALAHDLRPLELSLHLLLLRRSPTSGRLEEIVRMRRAFRASGSQTSDGRRYEEYYDKHKTALLFQLLRQLKKLRMYSGFTRYADLSSGSIRLFLKLCRHAFEYASAAMHDFQEPIPAPIQTQAALRTADDYFDELPKELEDLFGPGRNLVDHAGRLLERLQAEDVRMSEPERSYFTLKGQLSKDGERVLQALVERGFLHQRNPMRERRRGTPGGRDFILSRALVPRYSFSERIRGRTELKPQDVEALIMASDADAAALIGRLVREILRLSTNNAEALSLFT